MTISVTSPATVPLPIPVTPLQQAREWAGTSVATAVFHDRPWFGHDVRWQVQAGDPYGPDAGFPTLGEANRFAQQHATTPFPIQGAPNNPFGEASAILQVDNRFVPLALSTDLLAHSDEGAVTPMMYYSQLGNAPVQAVVDGQALLVPRR